MPTPLADLPVGHYFVRSASGDRNQFAVLPADYSGAPFLGSTADVPGWQTMTERNRRIQPGWTRIGWQSDWPQVAPTRDDRNWEPLDRRIAVNAGTQNEAGGGTRS